MKYFLFVIFVFTPCLITAQTVHNITAQTTRMSEDTLKKRFHLKPGDPFTREMYEKAQADLHKLRVFKTLEFLEQERKDGVDIHIKADDRSYVFPMLFALSGKKKSAGISLASGNLFKQGESIFLFAGGGEDGFASHAGLSIADHVFFLSYQHLNFEQRFYENGWTSAPGIFSTTDDKHEHTKFLLGEIRGKQDVLLLSYRYNLSHLWSLSITPQYEYYRYKNNALDTGNHSHISFSLRYTDDILPGMNMGALAGVGLSDREHALRNLPRVRTGKMAELTYITGSSWTGSDYEIQKIAFQGNYMWELKTRHLIAVYAKAQQAIKASFSDQIHSSDLLFGMGIYDREQRGKSGFSAGIAFTYFILRNQTGLLSLTPFYELAYISSGNSSYQPHSGIGGTLTYRLWRFPLPIGINFTHNLDDGSQHIGFKIGGRF